MKQTLIETLGLIEHIEGGYFTRTYQSPLESANRPLMTSIYYLLTRDRPIGHLHRNKSDILHYFHLGSPITYLLISPEGRLEKCTLGNDLDQGQQLQLLVKGGYWKASVLEQGEFGLLSEAVAPGFDYRDMEIAKAEVVKKELPHLWNEIAAYTAN